MKCPKCGYTGEFVVQIKTIVGLTKALPDEDVINVLSDVIRNRDGQYEYDVSSRCTCPKCEHTDALFKFGW